MALSEADTRAKLIDPKLYQKGWTEEHIKREETAGTILVINGKGKRRKGTTDYTLRIKVNADSQPVAVCIRCVRGRSPTLRSTVRNRRRQPP